MAKKQLDATYFQEPITVAQKDQVAVAASLQVFITLHEEEYNRLLLGDALYEAYVAGMNEDPVPAKWAALDDRLYAVNGTAKIAPSAFYVYWFYQRRHVTSTTGSGEKIVSTENSVSVGNNQKVKLAWNMMVQLGNSILYFLEANTGDYPQYVKPIDGLGSTKESRDLFKRRMNIIETVIPYF